MTRRYAEVIGDPIDHSKSPIIHRFWLENLGIDADYRTTRVAPEALDAFLDERKRDPEWVGCNITAPLKLLALGSFADPTRTLREIGAINTVFRDGADFSATNTDPGGFYAPIAERGLDLTGGEVAVIGAGGAARAVLFALARLKVGRVTMLNRSTDRAQALLDAFKLDGAVLPLDAPLPPVRLVVNASTIGMAGAESPEWRLERLPEDAWVYDIVYAPLETPLLAAAHARGLAAIDGLEMLVGQAALAFELLFGAEPPRDADDELRARLLA